MACATHAVPQTEPRGPPALAETIRDLSGYQGKIQWNTDKPDGQMKKILDVKKMKKVFKWEPPTSLRQGLKKTIDWYLENKEEADQRF